MIKRQALCDALVDDSALFKHEICFVLGQLQHPGSVPALTKVLENLDEHAMVRHEAAEALGAVATDEAFRCLQKYVRDDVPAVKDSVEVAIDMHQYWSNFNNRNETSSSSGNRP